MKRFDYSHSSGVETILFLGRDNLRTMVTGELADAAVDSHGRRLRVGGTRDESAQFGVGILMQIILQGLKIPL